MQKQNQLIKWNKTVTDFVHDERITRESVHFYLPSGISKERERKQCSASVENAKWIRLVFCLDKKQEKKHQPSSVLFFIYFIYCCPCKRFQTWPLATTFIEHDPSHIICVRNDFVSIVLDSIEIWQQQSRLRRRLKIFCRSLNSQNFLMKTISICI